MCGVGISASRVRHGHGQARIDDRNRGMPVDGASSRQSAPRSRALISSSPRMVVASGSQAASPMAAGQGESSISTPHAIAKPVQDCRS